MNAEPGWILRLAYNNTFILMQWSRMAIEQIPRKAA